MSNSMANPIRSDFLRFLKDQVLSITELTRTTKLSEILDMYASSTDTDKVYVIQNSRNKDAQAVLANADYFQELLVYKEAVEEAIDQVMHEIVRERAEDVGEISLAQVIADNDLDVDRILDRAFSDEEI